MPGPEAKTEYHWVAFLTFSDLPKLRVVMLSMIFPKREEPPNSPFQLALIPRLSGSLYSNCGVHSMV